MAIMNESQIFISYSRKDHVFVNEFANRLKRHGFNVWLDTNGNMSGIPSAVKWKESILEAIHQSSGAIRIISQNNNDENASEVCKWELQQIKAKSLPCKEIEAVEFKTEAEKEVILSRYTKAISEWNQQYVNTEENDVRTYLYSQSYLFSKDPKISHFVSKRNGFAGSFRYLGFLKSCKGYCEQNRLFEKDPESGETIKKYLRKAKSYTITGQLLVFAIGALVTLCVIMALAYAKILPQMAEGGDSLYRFNAVSYRIRKTINYDPVGASTYLTDEKWEQYYDSSKYFTSMQQLAVKLLEIHYPNGFMENGSQEAEGIKTIATTPDNEHYTVEKRGETKQIWIKNKINNKEFQLNLAAPSTVHEFVPGKNRLMIATSNKAYIYDLEDTMEPIELSYNFEDIESFRYKDNTIYAVTKRGNVISWQDPIPDKKMERLINNAVLATDPSTFYYLTDDSVIINTDNSEREIKLPLKINTDLLDVTNDGSLIVLSYKTESGGTGICVVSAVAGNVINDFEIEDSISDLSFSEDGSKVLAVTDYGIFIKDYNEELLFADIKDYVDYGKAWSMVDFGDYYVISTTMGEISEFDKQFKQKSKWINIIDLPVPIKKMAAAKDSNYLFLSSIGGNSVLHCTRYNLSNSEVSHLPVDYNPDMTSNTTVSVSKDEEAVVYGYPNGEIAVYDSKTLNLLYKNHTIAEPIIAVTISDDKKTIKALGRSGTVYDVDTQGFIQTVNLKDTGDYWQLYENKLEEIHKRMYDLGLTDV